MQKKSPLKFEKEKNYEMSINYKKLYSSWHVNFLYFVEISRIFKFLEKQNGRVIRFGFDSKSKKQNNIKITVAFFVFSFVLLF